MSEPLIDIRPDHWDMVADLLRRHVPDREVWAFGSRAKWNAKDYSDLDLAVMGDQPLPISVMADLEEAFRESDLPFKVDVVDWAVTSDNFRQIIETEYVVVQQGGRTGAGMAGAWKEVTVAEIAAPVRNALVGGPFGSNLVSQDYVGDGVPVIRGQNMGERWVSGGFAFVTPAKAESLAPNLAHPGDIVFTQRGTLGQVCLVPEGPFGRYLVSQSQMKLTVDREIADPLFFYYVFAGGEHQDYIRQRAIQTGVPHTNLSILRETPVPLPALPEQRAIVHILGTLDDKIELNRRMSETLEAMARAIFKSWFVDFDPIRAKCEGRDPGLPKHIADLFPDRFQDSELGEIPAGWRVGSVDGEFDLTMGQSPPGETYNEVGEGPPFYQGRADFGFRFPARRVYCTAPTRLAKVGDTLVSVRAPVGDINMAAENCAIGRGVAAVRHKTRARSYSYYSMRALEDSFARYDAEGTVFGSISKKDFHNLVCVVPSPDAVSTFERAAGVLDDKIELGEQQSRTLAALRDALLPKLISGELRVRDGERVAGSIV